MVKSNVVDTSVRTSPSFRPRPPVVRIYALGGLGEIGKNMYCIEFKNEIIIIDAGLKFPDSKMVGIDQIIPDVTYLIRKKKNIKALFLTHGHEDHIGGIPYLLKQLSIPIYGGALTIGLVKSKLDEHGLLDQAELHIIQGSEHILFRHLGVHFFRTMHSIPDAFGVIVETPFGPIVHTGDFKFDFTPESKPADLHKMMEVGKKGVLALLSDSTNSERNGQTPSEQIVGESILDTFQQCRGRIMFATFASNVHRLQQVVKAAIQCDRKIFVVGRSMEKVFSIGQALGYIQVPEGMILDIKKINSVPEHKVLIVCTGSQGEPNAALTRIAAGSHRFIQVYPKDTVIFSSSPIPGNVQNVNRSIDMLMRLGTKVIYGSVFDIHTSGHGSREDLKLMLRTIRPKYFVPIHGEYRMLVNHKRLAEQVGIPSNRIHLLNIGEPLLISKNYARKGKLVPSGNLFVSQGEIRHHEEELIGERKNLGENGIVIAAITVNQETQEVIFGPDLVSRGFIYVKEARGLLRKAESKLDRLLGQKGKEKEYDRETWSQLTKNVLSEFFLKEIGRTPIIVPSIHEITINNDKRM